MNFAMIMVNVVNVQQAVCNNQELKYTRFFSVKKWNLPI
ncbi:hypothetical protein RC62_260 [Flavobacterium aquidurense]|uniref:Uncharacterized protein n=1 Tax=Flavobacterium aquidurense TaxID=362413 RepID=A0A0Q0W1C2_9FLAO|nr:hypothetical protein RC62_260 [Flavobacterium aquidurense]